jgi:hypothetical protein
MAAKKRKSGGLLGRAMRALQGRPNQVDDAVDRMVNASSGKKRKKKNY